MLYVSLTRARNKQQVNFCDIEHYKPYKGHIYSYEYKGRYYIGSAKDLVKRKQEHQNGTKSGDTKFQKAIKLYGFRHFKYNILESIYYSNIHELWELEDKYIQQFNSIDNRFNHRRNTQVEI